MAAGRTGELLSVRPEELARVATQAAVTATARRTAVVAVGGDGTINAVAQAAHAEGCAMGVIPQGTFNYFARTHGIPTDAADAAQALLRSVPEPVQVRLMTVLLQISDPHFGTEQLPVVEALAVLSLQQRPDLLVLSGDITQRARPDQFRDARAFVDRLGVPVLAIPGNHNIPLFDLNARLFHPYSRYCDAFGDEMEPVHSSRELLVVCVNTTRWYRHTNGEVSTEQIERVASCLASAVPEQLRVVVVHQPVAVQRAEDIHDQLRGYAAALRRWAAAGGDLVMGGHIHLPYVMALPDLARPMWAVQAGTAVSSRVRGGIPNSVNLVRWGSGISEGRCLIERWDYAGNCKAFILEKVTEVKPGGVTSVCCN